MCLQGSKYSSQYGHVHQASISSCSRESFTSYNRLPRTVASACHASPPTSVTLREAKYSRPRSRVLFETRDIKFADSTVQFSWPDEDSSSDSHCTRGEN